MSEEDLRMEFKRLENERKHAILYDYNRFASACAQCYAQRYKDNNSDHVTELEANRCYTTCRTGAELHEDNELRKDLDEWHDLCSERTEKTCGKAKDLAKDIRNYFTSLVKREDNEEPKKSRDYPVADTV